MNQDTYQISISIAAIIFGLCSLILTALIVVRWFEKIPGRRSARRMTRMILRLGDVEEQVHALNKVVFPDQFKEIEKELHEVANEGNNESVAIIQPEKAFVNGHIFEAGECNKCHTRFAVDTSFAFQYCPGCGAMFTDRKNL